LVELVRECVPEIEIPWLNEVKRGEYLRVKVNAIETFVGPGKKEKGV
jgi:ribonuclease P/MRP protein subunit POP3